MTSPVELPSAARNASTTLLVSHQIIWRPKGKLNNADVHLEQNAYGVPLQGRPRRPCPQSNGAPTDPQITFLHCYYCYKYHCTLLWLLLSSVLFIVQDFWNILWCKCLWMHGYSPHIYLPVYGLFECLFNFAFLMCNKVLAAECMWLHPIKLTD